MVFLHREKEIINVKKTEKMNEKMFCFQCQETAGGTGCKLSGVCGKNPEV